MKALLTGATGFIGAAILRELLGRGWTVRALVRPTSPRANLMGLDVETVEGDLQEPDSLRPAMRGCEALFHCAALYALWVPEPEEIYRTNVEGTASILGIARELGVERVVYTSTIATVRLPEDGRLATEEDVLSADDAIGHYQRSKVLAEEAARKAHADGLPVVTVNPSGPVGPWDIRPTPTGKLIIDFVKGKMPGYMETGLNLVDVRDVAVGHVEALERGKPGERYILGAENHTLKGITEILSEITGVPSPKIKLPVWVALAYGALDELFVGRLLGRTPSVTRDGVRLARRPLYYDCSKAVRELGLPQTPVRKALEDAIAWFRENGHLPSEAGNGGRAP